ncbi:NAD(P)H-binding protein [Spirosoma koreense]
MKIVVTGSLGHISQPLATALIRKGHTVTIISSKPEKRKDIEAIGAQAAIGSLEDLDFLTATFTGADAAYCMVPPNYAELDQRAYYRRLGSHYAQAIQQSGVKRIVHLSSYGADLDKGTGVILGSHDIEAKLNELAGVALTHLRAGYIYYNLYNFVGMIKRAGFIGTNYGGADKLILVAPVDIATAAAEELQTSTSGSNVRYVVSDERTCDDVAQALGAAVGIPDLTWITFTDAQTQQGLEQNGTPASIAASLVELGAAIHSGVLQSDYQQQKSTEMGKVKLADFAREFATVFNK